MYASLLLESSTVPASAFQRPQSTSSILQHALSNKSPKKTTTANTRYTPSKEERRFTSGGINSNDQKVYSNFNVDLLVNSVQSLNSGGLSQPSAKIDKFNSGDSEMINANQVYKFNSST